MHWRPVTKANLKDCLALEVAEDQAHLVASVAKSLAQAYLDPNLHPYAIYDARAIGYEETSEPVVGFAVLEVAGGVGFILRLMIAAQHQGKGYGRASLQELSRRAKLFPDVQMVATSHLAGNEPMARLCAQLGFVPWDVSYAAESPDVFLRLGSDSPVGPPPI